jgi:hypothetical protein
VEEDMLFVLEIHIDDLGEPIALTVRILNRGKLNRLDPLDLSRQVNQFSI